MPPSGTVGWLLIFTPPLVFPLPPPFCSVTTFIELSKHGWSYSLLHFMTLRVPLKYACAWNFICKSFLPTPPHFVQGFGGGFLLALLPLLLSPGACHQPGKALRAGRQLLALGSQWQSANTVPWHQAVAMIPGYSCMGLYFISYFNHYHPKRRK